MQRAITLLGRSALALSVSAALIASGCDKEAATRAGYYSDRLPKQPDAPATPNVAPADIAAATTAVAAPAKPAKPAIVLPPADYTKLPTPGPVPEWTAPSVKTWEMGNGLKVWHVEQGATPLVSMALVLSTGAATDPDGKSGLTGLMLDMLDEGAGGKSATEIGEAFQRLAVDYGASPGTDGSTFYIDGIADTFDQALSLLTDILLKPSFPAAEFERRKAQAIASAIADEADPSTAAMLTLRSALFGGGYAAFSAGGTRDSLSAITLDDVKKHYDEAIKPEHGVVIVVGAINSDKLRDLLDKHLAGWSGFPGARDAMPAQPKPAGIYLVDFPGASQSVVHVARRVPAAGDQDEIPATIFNRALGGAFTSRINMNLREDKGYTYGARSRFVRYRRGGFYHHYSKVKSDTTGASIAEIQKELEAIRATKPLTVKERDDAVNGLVLGYPQRFEQSSKLASQLASMALDRRPADHLSKWLAAIKTVTRDQAESAGINYVSFDDYHIVVAGDANSIRTQLRALGKDFYEYNAQGMPKQ